MVNNLDIINQLKELGLDNKEAQIYLTLLQKGVLTPLELSRITKINRTTIYRLLESLKEICIVEEILDQKSTKFQAGDPQKLQMLLTKREAELSQIKQVLPNLITNLSKVEDTIPSPTKVIYYRGKSGLQQLLWNTLKAADKTEVVGYGYLNWNESIGRPFAEKIRQEYVSRKIYSKEILNTSDEEKKYTEVFPYVRQFYEGRYLPKSKLEINHDTYIYNDIFAFHHFFKDDLFGVEIHNPEIAKTQRQIFYLLWKMAKEI